jgi:hypothetical protein
MPDLLAGQVQVTLAPAPTVIGYIRAGKLRALAVTSATRLEVLPNVPTVAEFVPGYEASTWSGIGAPKNTPAQIVDKLNKEVNASLADSKLVAQLEDLGSIPIPMTPAAFDKFIGDEIDKWRSVLRTANIKLEWQCLLYPRKQTLLSAIGMSALCQKQTFCAAVKNVVIRSPRQRWRVVYREHPSQALWRL